MAFVDPHAEHAATYRSYTAVELAKIGRELVGTLATRGWRPFFAWGGVTVVLMGYLAHYNGAAVDLGQVNVLAGIILGAFVTRGAENAMAAR